MLVHPWMFWPCLIIWIVLHYWIDLYIASTPPSTMSTSYCRSLHPPISLCCYCILELYWLGIVLCICIYPSVYSEYRFISLLLTHMTACVFVFLLNEGRLTLYCNLYIAIEHSLLLLSICLLPQLLRAVAPALTLITSFKLRQVWCLPPIVDWLLDDYDVASVAV